MNGLMMDAHELDELNLSPSIVLAARDFRLLTKLARAGIDEASNVADDLLYELDRATVVPDDQMPPDVVRIGSTVRFHTTGGDPQEVMLVHPAEADAARNRLSVMTPVGTALIGLSKGHSITWLTNDSRKALLTVLDVT